MAATTAATAEAAEPPIPDGERNAFFDLDLETVIELERGVHRLHRAAGGIVLRVDRQIAGDAADRADPHHRLIDPPESHPIAHGLDRVAQNIEADTHVGDGGGRESGNVGEHGRSLRAIG